MLEMNLKNKYKVYLLTCLLFTTCYAVWFWGLGTFTLQDVSEITGSAEKNVEDMKRIDLKQYFPNLNTSIY